MNTIFAHEVFNQLADLFSNTSNWKRYGQGDDKMYYISAGGCTNYNNIAGKHIRSLLQQLNIKGNAIYMCVEPSQFGWKLVVTITNSTDEPEYAGITASEISYDTMFKTMDINPTKNSKASIIKCIKPAMKSIEAFKELIEGIEYLFQKDETDNCYRN